MPLKRLTSAVAIIFLFASVFMSVISTKAAGVITISLVTATCTGMSINVDNQDTITHNAQFIAGGVTSANTAIAPGTNVTFGVTFSFPGGSTINYDIYLDGSLVSSFSYTCAGTPIAPASVPGPSIPDGFVLRTIVCNVPVYATAAGAPVGTGEAIKAYQTWYINPVAVKVGKQSWTEIFVSSTINGFIPSACVGGKPAGYLGD